MSKILVLQGAPSTGKSTFAKKFVEENKKWIRVNRDDIRRMFGKYWLPKREMVVEASEYSIAEEALGWGWNVLVDDTNLNPSYIDAWKDIADMTQSEIEFKSFWCPLNEAIKRDSERENPVGEETIRNFYVKYNIPENI